MDTISLFCYGSNGVLQLKKRLGMSSPPAAIAAYARGYDRVFAGYSKRWKGGVATLRRNHNAITYGIVVQLTPEQLALLDTFETGYRRQHILVNIPGREQRKRCQVYIKDDETFTHPPSKEYVLAINRLLTNTKKMKS